MLLILYVQLVDGGLMSNILDSYLPLEWQTRAKTQPKKYKTRETNVHDQLLSNEPCEVNVHQLFSNKLRSRQFSFVDLYLYVSQFVYFRSLFIVFSLSVHQIEWLFIRYISFMFIFFFSCSLLIQMFIESRVLFFCSTFIFMLFSLFIEDVLFIVL